MEDWEMNKKNIMLAMLMLTVNVSKKEKTQKTNKEVPIRDTTKKTSK